VISPDTLTRRLYRGLLAAAAIVAAVTSLRAASAIPNYLPLVAALLAFAVAAAVLGLVRHDMRIGAVVFVVVSSVVLTLIVIKTFPSVLPLRRGGPFVLVSLALWATILAGLAVTPLPRGGLAVVPFPLLLQWHVFVHVRGMPMFAVVTALLVTALLTLLLASQILIVREQHSAAVVNQRLAAATAQLMDLRQRQSLALLAAGIAHEVSNPMNYLEGNLGFLREDVEQLAEEPDLPPERREALREDAYSILDAFEDGFAEVSAVVTRLRGLFLRRDDTKRRVEIRGVVDSVVAAARTSGGERPRVTFSPAPDIHHVQFHPADLYVVLSNLVRNAVESCDGKADVHIVTERTPNGAPCVAVVDSGPGIPDGVRQRVFDPFFTTKADRGGVGLGLALCRILAEKNGASIAIADSADSGTRVALIFREAS
jgi:signal transduction histidine kinase